MGDKGKCNKLECRVEKYEASDGFPDSSPTGSCRDTKCDAQETQGGETDAKLDEVACTCPSCAEESVIFLAAVLLPSLEKRQL